MLTESWRDKKERVIISDKSESQKGCSQKQLDGFQVTRMNTDKVTEFSSLKCLFLSHRVL